MFFNLSNHPSSSLIKEEKEAASKWGDIVDIAFPKNDVLADENEILEIAKNFLKSLKMTPKDAILVVGEYSLAFAIIDELLHQGVTVLTTISNSIVAFRTNENGIQESLSVLYFLNLYRTKDTQKLSVPSQKRGMLF